MKKGLTKVLVLAMMMTASTQAFAEEVSDLELELGRGKIEAAMNDTVSLKAALADRLNTLKAELEAGNLSPKAGTDIDTAIESLNTREMSASELLEKINYFDILINHVQNN